MTHIRVRLAALSLALVSAALSLGFIYIADDSASQTGSSTYRDNYVFYDWGIFSSDADWKADSAIRPYVASAITSWGNAITEFTFDEVSSSPDLEFLDTTCPTGAPACYRPDAWVDDAARDASYVSTGEIRIDSGYGWSDSDDPYSAAAHEIGHFIGLHERYPSPGSCNSSEITIMDGPIGTGTTHCDGLFGPSVLDISRVDDYWSEGVMSNFTQSSSGTVATFRWQDEAWAEQKHNLHFYYWDPNGLQWVEYENRVHAIDAGVHRDNEIRTLSTQIDRSWFGVPSGRYHIMCGDVYFIKYNTVGNWTCSGQVWVN